MQGKWQRQNPRRGHQGWVQPHKTSNVISHTYTVVPVANNFQNLEKDKAEASGPPNGEGKRGGSAIFPIGDR